MSTFQSEPGTIRRFANRPLLAYLRSLFDSEDLSGFERLALRGLFEQLDRLLDERDSIEHLRFSMAHVIIEGDSVARPTTLEQLALLKRVSEFFDGYYTVLSHLSGSVARFSRVFPGGSIANNGPFLDWFDRQMNDSTWRATHNELQRARQFRALLSHPQQFPPYDWGTGTHRDYANVHVVLHGPAGRGKNPIPPGAVRDDPFHAGLGDWTFESPDEVSVTNAIFIATTEVVARILVHLSSQSAFRKPLTIEEIRTRFAQAPVDVSEASRFKRIAIDLPPLDPSEFTPSSAGHLVDRSIGPLDRIARRTPPVSES